jgi:hypothetical protein
VIEDLHGDIVDMPEEVLEEVENFKDTEVIIHDSKYKE